MSLQMTVMEMDPIMKKSGRTASFWKRAALCAAGRAFLPVLTATFMFNHSNYSNRHKGSGDGRSA